MSCTTCKDMNPVPNCSENIVIGTVAANTDYWVFFTNIATGLQFYQEVTSDNNGQLTLPLSYPSQDAYMDGYIYTVVVTLPNTYDRVSITVGFNQYDCISIPFYSLYGQALNETVTVTAAE